MDPIENNKISSPHPDAMHPQSLNQAMLPSKDLQEDKSALTVEDRMAHIWAKHQVKEKRRIQLVAQAREIVTDFVQSTGKSGVVTAEIYDDIVVATTTNMVKTYLERRAVKEASQQASMLKLSILKSKEWELTRPPSALAMTVRGTPYASNSHPSSASAPATSSLFRNAFGHMTSYATRSRPASLPTRLPLMTH